MEYSIEYEVHKWNITKNRAALYFFGIWIITGIFQKYNATMLFLFLEKGMYTPEYYKKTYHIFFAFDRI